MRCNRIKHRRTSDRTDQPVVPLAAHDAPGCNIWSICTCSGVAVSRGYPAVRPGRHSYSGVPVTEVAAAREDVTHVVYVCAFAMPAGTSMLDALGGRPREWWIFAEDGGSIMPDYPGPLLYG